MKGWLATSLKTYNLITGDKILNLKAGTVIRIFSLDVDKPKVKWIIIVAGNSDAIATIFINTETRLTDLTGSLQALQLPLSKEKCSFLKHDSYADCSDLREKSKSEINRLLQKEPGRKEGEIPQDIMQEILAALKRAKSISPILKKKYGLSY